MSAAESDSADSDENPHALQCAQDATEQAHGNAPINAHVCKGVAGDAAQQDILRAPERPNEASDVDKKADAARPEIMSKKRQNVVRPSAMSDVDDFAQADESLHLETKPSGNQGVLIVLDELTQQLQDDISDAWGELSGGDGTPIPQDLTSQVPDKLNRVDTIQLPNDQRELNASLLALLDAARVAQHAQCDSRSNLSPARRIAAARESASLASQADVSKAVLDLIGATQHLQEDPSNVESINNLISRLKNLLLEERQTYAFMRQNSMSRNKLESLHNLIRFLESQVQQLQKAAHRRGLKYYMAGISNKVRGDEVGRIGKSMESELQSWLDQQSVREIASIILRGSEDAQLRAISTFKLAVQKGYKSVLQETILSTGLVERLAGLLAPGAASWEVARETVFAFCALIDFNKDMFVSLILMSKTVGNILCLMNSKPDEHVLILVSAIKRLLAAGHTIVVDEIFTHNGVSKFVQLLDNKLQDLQHAAMDCLFEMAYYGNIEVVNKMFELEVVKKIAVLQQANTAEAEHGSIQRNKPVKNEQENPLDLAASWIWPMTSTPMLDGDTTDGNPFADAVTKFALHLSIGTGLRKRDKRTLKQEFLRQIKEVMEDDAEIANITAEVLWAP